MSLVRKAPGRAKGCEEETGRLHGAVRLPGCARRSCFVLPLPNLVQTSESEEAGVKGAVSIPDLNEMFNVLAGASALIGPGTNDAPATTVCPACQLRNGYSWTQVEIGGQAGSFFCLALFPLTSRLGAAQRVVLFAGAVVTPCTPLPVCNIFCF